MRAAAAAAAVVTAGLIGALVAVPLESLGRVAADGGLTGIARALSAPASRVAIMHTVAVAGAVTVLAVTAGTALALAVERRPARSRLLPRLLVAGPLVIPEFVLGFAWSQAYGPAGLSDRMTGLTMPGLFGPAGIIAVLTVYGLPLAYLAVTAGLAARADPALERAARAAGAGGWATLRTVTLPLLRVPLLGAAALVFVTAAGSFAVPQVLGTPAGFATMSTLIYSDLALSAGPAAFTELVVLALTMVALVLLALGPLDLWLARLPRAARPETPPAVTAPRTAGDRTVMVIVWGYAILAAGIPMLTLILTALTRGPGLAPVPANWTLANFRSGFSGGAGAALARSAGLALAAAVAAPALGGTGGGPSPRPLARPAGHRGHPGLRHPGFGARGRHHHRVRPVAGRLGADHPRRLRGEVLGVRAPSGAGGPGPAAARPDPRRAAERRPARHRGPHRGPAPAHRGRRHRGRAGVRPGLPRTDHVHHLVRAGHRDLRGGHHEPAGSRRRRRDRGARPGADRAGGAGGRGGRLAGPPHRGLPRYPERIVVPLTAAPVLRMPNAVACAGLSVGYGRPALAGLDLAVTPGETLALLGSSGSGKTTLLNAIAGFAAPLAGQIWLAGELVSGPGG